MSTRGLALLLALVAALATHTVVAQPCTTVYKFISSTPSLSQLKVAVDRTGTLVKILDDPELQATVFLPNNLGINLFFYQASLVSNLVGDQVTVNDVSVPQLTSILTYHVTPTVLPTSSLTEGFTFDTLAGRKLVVKLQNSLITLVGDSGFVGLAPGISNVPGEFDVPACKALVNIIGYPVVPRGVLPLVKAPPRCATPLQVMRGNPQLSLFVRALQLAGLENVVDNMDSALTIFAPTNMAFNLFLMSQTPRISLEDVATAQLSSISSYSIVNGVFNAADLTNGRVLPTQAGRSLTVEVLGGLVTLKTDIGMDGAAPAISSTPGETNIAACRSVIHMIGFPVVPAGVLPLRRQVPLPPPRPVIFGPYANIVESLNGLDMLSSMRDLLVKESWFTTNDFIQRGATFGQYFMPSNDALARFQAQNAGVPLTRILQYHFVLGDSRPTSEWKDGDTFATQTSNGEFITIVKPSAAPVFLKGSRNAAPCTIVNANNRAGLGLMHVIDCVLVPNP